MDERVMYGKLHLLLCSAIMFTDRNGIGHVFSRGKQEKTAFALEESSPSSSSSSDQEYQLESVNDLFLRALIVGINMK